MDVTRHSTLLATGSAIGLAGCDDDISGGTPTEDEDGHVHEDELEVRPDLQRGRCRFVYERVVSG